MRLAVLSGIHDDDVRRIVIEVDDDPDSRRMTWECLMPVSAIAFSLANVRPPAILGFHSRLPTREHPLDGLGRPAVRLGLRLSDSLDVSNGVVNLVPSSTA